MSDHSTPDQRAEIDQLTKRLRSVMRDRFGEGARLGIEISAEDFKTAVYDVLMTYGIDSLTVERDPNDPSRIIATMPPWLSRLLSDGLDP